MRHNSVLRRESAVRMRVRRSQIRSRLAPHLRPTMRTWAAGHRHLHHQSNRHDNRHHRATPFSKPNIPHREAWTQKIRTGQEHVGRRQDEGQCLQEPTHSIPVHTMHRLQFLRIKADRQTHDHRLAGQKLSRPRLPRLFSRHQLQWRRRPSRPNLFNLLQMSFISIRHQLFSPPSHPRRCKNHHRSLRHKALSRTRIMLSRNRRAHRAPSHTRRTLSRIRRAHKVPSLTLPSQHSRYARGRISACVWEDLLLVQILGCLGTLHSKISQSVSYT